MTYNPNIPQATDNPSNSQSQILANFQQLNMQYGTAGDHVPFTASTNNGKHNSVTWLDQTAQLPIVPVANELIAYGITKSGVTMPYYVRDSISSATTQFPLAPIKAYASFLSINAGGMQNITPLDSFNIAPAGAPVIVQQSGSPTTFTITLINPCRTTTYGVSFIPNLAGVAISLSSGFTGYSITSTSVFVLTIPFIGVPPARLITVMVLET